MGRGGMILRKRKDRFMGRQFHANSLDSWMIRSVVIGAYGKRITLLYDEGGLGPHEFFFPDVDNCQSMIFPFRDWLVMADLNLPFRFG